MHAVPKALWLTVFVPASLAAAQPVATFEAFDRSIEATKQAMNANPEQALRSAHAAVALARRLPSSHKAEVALATAEWLHGEALIFTNKLDEAAPVVAATLKLVERVSPNTKLHGDLLRSHGAIAASKGNVLEALRAYQKAYEVFRHAKVARSEAIALQDIGAIYWEAADYDRTLSYYQESADAFSGDPALTLTMQNNRAQVYSKQKRYAEAAGAYRSALVEARKLESPLLQVRILTNLAASEAEAHRLASAQKAIDQAASLARHGEAAGWRPFIDGVAARIALDRGDIQSARQLIERCFNGVDLARSEMLFRDYHQTAANIFERLGEEPLALTHLRAFQRLDREAQSLTASAASQLMAARFDFANQNLKIEKLRQGQLLRDIELERQSSSARITLLSSLSAVGALLLAVLLFGFFSIRRSRDEVRGANHALSDANSALEKALQAKTEFLATTSHEIRTPLNGILGMTQVLLTDRRLAADVRDRIEVVHGAGETMRALVDDILDVAKIESGNLTLSEDVVQLRHLLDEVTRLWTDQAATKGVKVRAIVGDLPVRILSDGSRLRQIVFNLMANAVKFTASGHVTLHARADLAAEGPDSLIIAVEDTGIGIPADKLDDIFEAFQQVDGGTTRQFGGTGLGLAICRNLARAMGGDLTVESVLGKGSTFTLRLPLMSAREPVQCTEEKAALDTASLLV